MIAVPVQVSEQVMLPVPVMRAWEYLGDTARMVELDPLLESYEPEGGAISQGTTNRVVSRLGPLRMRLVTRTTVLDAPHRAVFESVKPRWPLRVRTEDVLIEHREGTLYRVTSTVRGAGPIGAMLARPVARRMMRTRRQLMERVRQELAESG
jgi:carbon monoxide dehydrogenase subunit G